MLPFAGDFRSILPAIEEIFLGTKMNLSLDSLTPVVTSSWTIQQTALAISFLISIDILTMVGNALVIFIVLKTQGLRQRESNLFAVNLAISDLLVSMTAIPFTLDVLVEGKVAQSANFKEFHGFSNFFFCISSIMNLLLLSVDRFIAISKPFRYLNLMTRGRAQCLCVCVWVYAMLCALPPKLGVSSYYCFIPNIDVCLSEDWSGSHNAVIFAGLVLGLTYGLSLSVMAFCYWNILRITHSHVHRLASVRVRFVAPAPSPSVINVEDESNPGGPRVNSNLSTLGADIKVATGFLFVIRTYLVCWTLFCVLLAVRIVDRAGHHMHNEQARLVCLWIGYSNSVFNPFIYTWKYKQFRQGLFRTKNSIRAKF